MIRVLHCTLTQNILFWVLIVTIFITQVFIIYVDFEMSGFMLKHQKRLNFIKILIETEISYNVYMLSIGNHSGNHATYTM